MTAVDELTAALELTRAALDEANRRRTVAEADSAALTRINHGLAGERDRLADQLDIAHAACDRLTRHTRQWRQVADGLACENRDLRAQRDRALTTSQQLRVGILTTRETTGADR
ncbi:hypothetical protein QTQ03_16550 [Micromonospora sp. WMMA1363]|uniref:hypothetical protein n=1 Tax=Micromonospora sp. WMMA1363 TaxID=3053985 RepID=UPI00259C9D36|nr:hypothetical protein [Micromonospora sp. WMMA1363]MDM4721129.1 hypothetical protein [Micromonospora sp. WMMA1363]